MYYLSLLCTGKQCTFIFKCGFFCGSVRGNAGYGNGSQDRYGHVMVGQLLFATSCYLIEGYSLSLSVTFTTTSTLSLTDTNYVELHPKCKFKDRLEDHCRGGC